MKPHHKKNPHFEECADVNNHSEKQNKMSGKSLKKSHHKSGPSTMNTKKRDKMKQQKEKKAAILISDMYNIIKERQRINEETSAKLKQLKEWRNTGYLQTLIQKFTNAEKVGLKAQNDMYKLAGISPDANIDNLYSHATHQLYSDQEYLKTNFFSVVGGDHVKQLNISENAEGSS